MLVAGCVSSGSTGQADTGDAEAGTGELAVHPGELDFGALEVGEHLSETLTILNRGEAEVRLVSVELEQGTTGFSLGSLSSFQLLPGASTALEVRFSPEGDGRAEDLLLLETEGAATACEVELAGDGMAPVSVLEPQSLELGEVSVGCEVTGTLTIANEGSLELEVQAVEVSEQGEGFTWEPAGEFLDDPPWYVEPQAELDLGTVAFSPFEEGDRQFRLRVETDDPNGPTETFAATATGVVIETREDAFSTRYETLDLLFAIDASGSMTEELEAIAEAFSAFTSALADAGADYRVAMVVSDDGCVAGDLPWIDETLQGSELQNAVQDMIFGAEAGDLAEQGFALLEMALAQSQGGGCNAGLVRETGTLHLVGVSDEHDQSPRDHDDYLDGFEALKADPSQVFVHAIGGDYPSGCDDAEPYSGFYEASYATGGVFMSICTDDWEHDLASFGASVAEVGTARTVYSLSEEPVEDTLSVTLGGEAFSDWSWEPEQNAVVVEAEALDGSDAELVVSYVVAEGC